MQVKLISVPLGGEIVSILAAAVCVGKAQTRDGASNLKGFEHALASGHLSLLEHLPLSFWVTGVSRSCLAQYMTHRMKSCSTQSQRYVKIDFNSDWYITPDTIKNNQDIYSEYLDAIHSIEKFYNKAIEQGIPKEDARFILPNATTTEFITSMNARAFVELAQKRLCNRAQWEINQLVRLMRKEVKRVYPHVGNLAVPNCKLKGCTEKKPCGRQWEDY